MEQPSSGAISDDDKLERAVWNEHPRRDLKAASSAQNPASEIQEWTMLLHIITSGNEKTVNIVNLHKAIFTLMHQSNDKFVVKTLQGTLIDSASDFLLGHDYQTHFRTQESKNHFVVAHSVYSSKALEAIKRNHPALLKLLRANNVFINLSVTGSLYKLPLQGGARPDFGDTSGPYLQKATPF
jgi:hypothetical protein